MSVRRQEDWSEAVRDFDHHATCPPLDRWDALLGYVFKCQG
jgi:hypothetical protein